MSSLGKIFLYLALIGAVVAVVAGLGVIQQRGEDARKLVETTAAVTVANSNTKKAQAEADAAKAAQAQAESDLAAQKSKLDDLNTKLTDEQQKETTLQQAVTDSKAATAKAQADLDHVTSVLKGQTPEAVEAQLDKLTSQVAADNAEQKILQDQLQASVAQAAEYKTEINKVGRPDSIPPGVTGKVTFVNPTWNFVVLNVGLSNGVVPNGELIVYRGRDFIGKVKVTSAEDNTSVADILPGVKADIQVGDDVLN
jgi:cell shape-determining protein MreC